MAVATEEQIYFKPISILVSRMVPDYVIAEYPQFVTWMEKYFEYMEQQLKQYDMVANLLNYRDVDTTLATFETSFKDRFLHSFPEALAANVDLLVKNVRSFYKSRGTEDSFRFLFKALFNSDVEFFYPKQHILRTSDGLWYAPEYLVLTDQNGNLPPRFPNGDAFDLTTLVDEFIFGVTTGTVSLVDRTAVKLYDGGFAIHLEILEKEGEFQAGEQIVLGNNIVENGSFSDDLQFWTLDPLGDELINTNLLNELEFEQNVLTFGEKYVTQGITVEESTQYYLRYSLVANKTGVGESAVRFDSDLSRVAVGSTPGGNDLFDSGRIGSYVDVDLDSANAVNEDMRWQPSGESNGIVNIHHINYDLQSDPGAYTPIGAGLTVKDTARISEFDDGAAPSYDFEADTDVDDSTDEITIIGHQYHTADRVRFTDNGNVEPVGLTPDDDYYVIVVDVDTIQLAASISDANGGTQINITADGSGTMTLTTPTRVHMSTIQTPGDFVYKSSIHASNGYVLLVSIDEVLTASNFYVWSSTATYDLAEFVIKDDILYRSTLASNTTDPSALPITNWVVVPSLLVDGEVELGAINTLKLLPATNSQQKELYVSVFNDMTVDGHRSTFDGVSLVKKDVNETPLLFIANQNGVSGIVTDPYTWKDTRGFLSADMFLQDNYYYQEFSYEVQSTVSLSDFEQVVRDNVHPAGFKLFAKVNVGAVDDSALMDQVIDLQMYYTMRTPAAYYASDKLAGTFDAASDVDPGTDNITLTGHDLTDGDVVRLRTVGTAPTGLINNMEYYVIYVDANTIQLATTFPNAISGTQINITADGSGTVNLHKDRITYAASEINYKIADFFNKGQTYEQVEYNREVEEANGGLLADLAQIVADIPIGYFEDNANDTFPWSGSYDVTITP